MSRLEDTAMIGGFALIFHVLFAPVFLAIALLSLFFRAPLAAILGSIVVYLIYVVGAALTQALVVDLNPFQALLLIGFAFCVGAGICYGLTSGEWMARFFEWECEVLGFMISKIGIFGRAFYIFIQVIPGLVFILLLFGTVSEAASAEIPMPQADKIIAGIVLFWLAASQFLLIRFHRTDHPIGKFCTFDGGQSEFARQEIQRSNSPEAG